MWLTEHPRLLIYPVDITKHQVFKQTDEAEDVDLLIHLNTKFLYVEQSYKREFSRMHAYTVHRRCLLHREILKNRLALAPLAPNVVGGLIKDAPGHVGRIMGEALFVMQCAPTPVELRETNRCFVELPVITLNNESLFMSPVTRILQTFGEEVECSSIVMPLFHIEGQWVGFNPKPIVGIQPEELRPEAEPSIKFSPIQQLGLAGLYNAKDLQKLQSVMTFGASKDAISNIMIRRAMGAATEDQGLQFAKLFSKVDLQTIAEDTAKRVWGWMADIGLVTSGFIGIYTVLRLAKYCVSVIINGFTIHAVTGWSIYLLASLWDALTLWAMRRKQRTQMNTSAENPRPTGAVYRANAADNEIPPPPRQEIYPSLNL